MCHAISSMLNAGDESASSSDDITTTLARLISKYLNMIKTSKALHAKLDSLTHSNDDLKKSVANMKQAYTAILAIYTNSREEFSGKYNRLHDRYLQLLRATDDLSRVVSEAHFDEEPSILADNL
jgi:uncharacterized coiled-coil DUF342 family protein